MNSERQMPCLEESGDTSILRLQNSQELTQAHIQQAFPQLFEIREYLNELRTLLGRQMAQGRGLLEPELRALFDRRWEHLAGLLEMSLAMIQDGNQEGYFDAVITKTRREETMATYEASTSLKNPGAILSGIESELGKIEALLKMAMDLHALKEYKARLGERIGMVFEKQPDISEAFQSATWLVYDKRTMYDGQIASLIDLLRDIDTYIKEHASEKSTISARQELANVRPVLDTYLKGLQEIKRLRKRRDTTERILEVETRKVRGFLLGENGYDYLPEVDLSLLQDRPNPPNLRGQAMEALQVEQKVTFHTFDVVAGRKLRESGKEADQEEVQVGRFRGVKTVLFSRWATMAALGLALTGGYFGLKKAVDTKDEVTLSEGDETYKERLSAEELEEVDAILKADPVLTRYKQRAFTVLERQQGKLDKQQLMSILKAEGFSELQFAIAQVLPIIDDFGAIDANNNGRADIGDKFRAKLNPAYAIAMAGIWHPRVGMVFGVQDKRKRNYYFNRERQIFVPMEGLCAPSPAERAHFTVTLQLPEHRPEGLPPLIKHSNPIEVGQQNCRPAKQVQVVLEQAQIDTMKPLPEAKVEAHGFIVAQQREGKIAKAFNTERIDKATSHAQLEIILADALEEGIYQTSLEDEGVRIGVSEDFEAIMKVMYGDAVKVGVAHTSHQKKGKATRPMSGFILPLHIFCAEDLKGYRVAVQPTLNGPMNLHPGDLKAHQAKYCK